MEHKIGPTRCGRIRKYGYPDLQANDSYGNLHTSDVELGDSWLRVGNTRCTPPTLPPWTSRPTAPSYRRIWGRTIWSEKDKEAEFQQALRDDGDNVVRRLAKGRTRDSRMDTGNQNWADDLHQDTKRRRACVLQP